MVAGNRRRSGGRRAAAFHTIAILSRLLTPKVGDGFLLGVAVLVDAGRVVVVALAGHGRVPEHVRVGLWVGHQNERKRGQSVMTIVV